MGIALVVVGGLFLMTVAASLFGYLGEKKKRLDPALEERISLLERRLSSLEEKAANGDERFDRIESDVAFVNRLISDKHS